MKKMILIVLALMSFTACNKTESNQAAEGHEQGNGYEDHDSYANDYTSWVSGRDSEIKYCFTVSPNFGADAQTIQQTLSEAFKTWADYIAEKNVNKYLEKYYRARYENQMEWPAYKDYVVQLLMPTKSKLLPSCDGSQNIHFRFGTEDSFVIEQKKFHKGVAFTAKSKEIWEQPNGSHQGVVWLKEADPQGTYTGVDWTKPYRLLSVLIHEVGHTYGLSEIPGTIMSADIFNLFGPTKETPEYHDYLTRIDHTLQVFAPYSIEDNLAPYEGRMAYTEAFKYPTKSDSELALEAAENFKLITGQDAQGKIKAQFKYPVITISDEVNTYQINIINLGKQISTSRLNNSFSTNYFWKHTDEADGTIYSIAGYNFLYQMANSQTAEIVTPTGIKLPIIIEQNMDEKLIISYLMNGERRALIATYSSFWFF